MNNKFLRFPLYLLFFILLFVACDGGLEDIEVDPPTYDYLISTELVNSYTKSEISGYINLAMLVYPDQKETLEQLLTQIETGVNIYKIIYKTEFDGADLMASGLVCLPDQTGSYPILSYQNGTNTEHSNAPTEDPNNQLFQILEMMGSTGFIVTIPDYLGFGETDDMFHPYLHKESTVQSVMDMLRATKEMVANDKIVEFNNELYLTGYSQGGWATMALHEAIQKTPTNEFRLMASSCGAGPYNITTLNEYVTSLETYPQPNFIAYIFNSYLNLGLSTSISEVFQSPYDERIPTLFDGTNSGTYINQQLTTTVTDLFTADYLTGWSTDSKHVPVTDMLEENSIVAFKTTVPILLTHGTTDGYVPPIVTNEIYDDFKALGVENLVTYMPLDGLDHGGAIVPSGLASISWFIQLKN